MVEANGITSAGSFAKSADVEAMDWQKRRYSGTVRMSLTMHFESAKRQHRQYWDWRRNRNEARWTQQERGEMDYDAKNMMHLMRLLYSGEGIVRNGEPIVRFSGEKLERLLSIKRGEWSFDEIMAEASAVQANIEAGRNRLPPECDRQKVDELIAEVMEAAGVA